jgi:hypothetical protein
MDKSMLVAYCGLFCGSCGVRNETAERAQALMATLKQAEMDQWGAHMPDFSEFWRFLGMLADAPDDKRCRSGHCGTPNCAIRNCCQSRGIEVCALCADYPCAMIETFAQGQPQLLADGQRIKEVGLEQWAEEQLARR